ncbi:hypothetical protein KUCAC02_033202 [Chaenocephalus aceratus]|nr:hypothetical protein KUCAC02_033202 [Chaenocephalus aceratus]
MAILYRGSLVIPKCVSYVSSLDGLIFVTGGLNRLKLNLKSVNVPGDQNRGHCGTDLQQLFQQIARPPRNASLLHRDTSASSFMLSAGGQRSGSRCIMGRSFQRG